MRNIEKKDFIGFLKNISDVLEKNEIKHDIPFCHIDKKSYNHINFIIPDIITMSDIIKNLNDVTEIKESNSIITCKIDEFDVRFIKTSEQMWSYAFYYYSWDILSTLFNVLSLNYSMIYTNHGLYYLYKDKKILISRNLVDIFDFFDLPFQMLVNGFLEINIMFSFIESSNNFNKNDFSMNVFKNIDDYFENNIGYYEDFLKHMPDIEIDKKTIEEQIALIDAYFPKSDFIFKLTKIQMKEDFPNIKENDIVMKEKDMHTILQNKQKQIQNQKKNKKINLSKYFNLDNGSQGIKKRNGDMFQDFINKNKK